MPIQKPGGYNNISPIETLCFATLVSHSTYTLPAYRMVSSIREFGGRFSRCRILVFTPNLQVVGKVFQDLENIEIVPLVHEEGLDSYFFGKKAAACAQAEKMNRNKIHSLVWLDPTCLVIQPPDLLDLPPSFKAAFRPVHIRNVGSLAGETRDLFWGRIYEAVGVTEAPFTIESFIDTQVLRPYFNTHLFAIDPSIGLMERWLMLFRELILDQKFQDMACQDTLHQIFLHQAVLSTLLIQTVNPAQIKMLPAEYSYPLHLHSRVPDKYRIRQLEETVIPVYEGEDSSPERVEGLEISEKMRSWLEETIISERMNPDRDV